jgi:hypothetical protein
MYFSKIRIAAARKFRCWQGTSVVALVRIHCTPPPRSHPSWERRQTDRPGADRPPWPESRAGSSTCNRHHVRQKLRGIHGLDARWASFSRGLEGPAGLRTVP